MENQGNYTVKPRDLNSRMLRPDELTYKFYLMVGYMADRQGLINWLINRSQGQPPLIIWRIKRDLKETCVRLTELYRDNAGSDKFHGDGLL